MKGRKEKLMNNNTMFMFFISRSICNDNMEMGGSNHYVLYTHTYTHKI